MKILRFVFLIVIVLDMEVLAAQRIKQNPVYVDTKGVMRWTKTNKEATFFGVNYTVPFAYGYRSHKALNVDVKKAIDNDVYHFARLGLDAFRVHVWDTEISDSSGNLIENEHLDLFDYLLLKCRERNIKVLLTPLAFWGNGYPEKDENTGSFSSIYNKQKVLVTENAIKAQENYLQQFLKHKSTYTNETYLQNQDIIALEINNEPQHSGSKSMAKNYIDRMVTAVKNTGWSKPIVYNISESPKYADVVAGSNIEGVSFQWYPTGLVSDHTLQGNYLPNVDEYKIPFTDTIPRVKNKAKFVYEFDAGDVYQSCIYPAMVRSFRTAGFQWATQFAYDPMATAYANTEYQTHYLNLAYTPSKAISLMIAAKAFHNLPRQKSYGSYPEDSVFENFRVSYLSSLSEMNSDQEFYYSNNTLTTPKNIAALKHIAGVGNSSIIKYEGTGVYFLDKLPNNNWRLEVMPDAIPVNDPFEKSSLKKIVTAIHWQKNMFKIVLPALGKDYRVTGINQENNFKGTAVEYSIRLLPGTYILSAKDVLNSDLAFRINDGNIKLSEFVAPQSTSDSIMFYHLPVNTIAALKAYQLTTTLINIDSNASVKLEVRHSNNDQWKILDMSSTGNYKYSVTIPAEYLTPGKINYRILISSSKGFHIYPGNYTTDPYAWDTYTNETWHSFVSDLSSANIFFPKNDQKNIVVYNTDWKENKISYPLSDREDKLDLMATLSEKSMGGLGWELFIGDEIQANIRSTFDTLIITGKSSGTATIKVILRTKYGNSYSAVIDMPSEYSAVPVALKSFMSDSALLLPRPYPGFQALKFKASGERRLAINDIEKIQIEYLKPSELRESLEIRIAGIDLQ